MNFSKKRLQPACFYNFFLLKTNDLGIIYKVFHYFCWLYGK